MYILHNTQDALIFSMFKREFQEGDRPFDSKRMDAVLNGLLHQPNDPTTDLDRHTNILGDYRNISPYGDLSSESRLLASHATVRLRLFPQPQTSYEEFSLKPRTKEKFSSLCHPCLLVPYPQTPAWSGNLSMLASHIPVHAVTRPNVHNPKKKTEFPLYLESFTQSTYTRYLPDGRIGGFLDFLFLFAHPLSEGGPFSRFFVNKKDSIRLHFNYEYLLRLGLIDLTMKSKALSVCSTLWGEWI